MSHIPGGDHVKSRREFYNLQMITALRLHLQSSSSKYHQVDCGNNLVLVGILRWIPRYKCGELECSLLTFGFTFGGRLGGAKGDILWGSFFEFQIIDLLEVMNGDGVVRNDTIDNAGAISAVSGIISIRRQNHCEKFARSLFHSNERAFKTGNHLHPSQQSVANIRRGICQPLKVDVDHEQTRCKAVPALVPFESTWNHSYWLWNGSETICSAVGEKRLVESPASIVIRGGRERLPTLPVGVESDRVQRPWQNKGRCGLWSSVCRLLDLVCSTWKHSAKPGPVIPVCTTTLVSLMSTLSDSTAAMFKLSDHHQ